MNKHVRSVNQPGEHIINYQWINKTGQTKYFFRAGASQLNPS